MLAFGLAWVRRRRSRGRSRTQLCTAHRHCAILLLLAFFVAACSDTAGFNDMGDASGLEVSAPQTAAPMQSASTTMSAGLRASYIGA